VTVHPTKVAAQARTDQAFQRHEPLPLPAASPARVKSWRMWYDDIIDWVLTHPGQDLKGAAGYLGRSPQWLRLIVRSDAFQARLAKRRDETSHQINEGITQRLSQTALTGLDILLQQMETKRTNIPIERVIGAVDMTLTRLGYGEVPAAAQTNVQVNIGASPDALAQARETLREVEARKTLPLVGVAEDEAGG
jgi:hypothetical protein